MLLATLWALLGGGCAPAQVHAPTNAPRATPTKTVVLIHGMFVDPSCWDRWIPYLEAQGYRVLAPAWPAHEGTAAEARAAHPDPALAAVGLDEVVDHYRRILATLDHKPVLIGHSMGGLVVQRLLAEDLAAAAIAIDAAPPKGVFSLSPKFLKSNGRILRGSLDEPLDMDARRFAYMFVNEQPSARQAELFERYARPESRRVGRSATKDAGAVDVSRRRAPLLLVAGQHDHAVPPVITRKTFRRYRKGPSFTAYREVAGADHWLIGGERWQEVADLSLAWLAEVGAREARAQ